MLRRGRPPLIGSGGRIPPDGRNPEQPEVVELIRQAMTSMMPDIVQQTIEAVRKAFRELDSQKGINDDFSNASSDSSSDGSQDWLERFEEQRPLAFTSVKEPIEAEDWIHHLEIIFGVLKCPDQYKVRLAVHKLEKEAHNWWNSCVQANPCVEDFSWEQFKGLFYDLYFTVADRAAYIREYFTIRQCESETILEYLSRFSLYARASGTFAGTAAQQADMFQRTLNDEWACKLANMKFGTLAQISDAIRSLDKTGVERADGRSSSKKREYGDLQKSSDNPHSKRYKPEREVREDSNVKATRCDDCLRWHKPGRCWKKLGACFNCHEVGHLAKNCKKGRSYKYRDNGKQAATSGCVFAIPEDNSTSGT